MQQLTPGEASFQAEEASYNLLCSRLHLVGRTTTLHSQNHLCKTPGSTVAVFHPKSSSVHLTSDIQDKKMKNCIASSIFTYYFTLLPSHFCCLSTWLGKFIQGCWAGIFLLQCSHRPQERSTAFKSPVTELLYNLISNHFISRVMQVTAVR